MGLYDNAEEPRTLAEALKRQYETDMQERTIKQNEGNDMLSEAFERLQAQREKEEKEGEE